MRERWWLSSALAVIRRPDLWVTAVRVSFGLVPRRWWAQGRHLPVPAEQWIRFRMETAYGDPEARPPASDLLDFLEWCRHSRMR